VKIDSASMRNALQALDYAVTPKPAAAPSGNTSPANVGAKQ
jgi:hypothetical protein